MFSPLLCFFVAWDKGEPLHIPKMLNLFDFFAFIVSSWLSVALCKAKEMPNGLLLEFRRLAARSFSSLSGSVKDLQTNDGKAADFSALWAPTCHDNKQHSHNPASDAHVVSLSTTESFDHGTDIEPQPQLSTNPSCHLPENVEATPTSLTKEPHTKALLLLVVSRLLHHHPPRGFGRKQQPRDY